MVRHPCGRGHLRDREEGIVQVPSSPLGKITSAISRGLPAEGVGRMPDQRTPSRLMLVADLRGRGPWRNTRYTVMSSGRR